jgi:hypothetical protein
MPCACLYWREARSYFDRAVQPFQVTVSNAAIVPLLNLFHLKVTIEMAVDFNIKSDGDGGTCPHCQSNSLIDLQPCAQRASRLSSSCSLDPFVAIKSSWGLEKFERADGKDTVKHALQPSSTCRERFAIHEQHHLHPAGFIPPHRKPSALRIALSSFNVS